MLSVLVSLDMTLSLMRMKRYKLVRHFDSFRSSSQFHLRKIMIVLYTIFKGQIYYLLVHDARYNEWTFISGGCKGKEFESYLDSANRELQEETRNIMGKTTVLSDEYSIDRWITGEDGRRRAYRIYFLPLNINDYCLKCISEYFCNTPPRNKSEAENSDLRFFTATEFANLPMWKSSRDVLNHGTFPIALRKSIINQQRHILNIPKICID